MLKSSFKTLPVNYKIDEDLPDKTSIKSKMEKEIKAADVRYYDKLNGIILNKIIEWSEEQRAYAFIKDVFNELHLSAHNKYRGLVIEFILCHNILEIDERKHWNYMSYNELKFFRKAIHDMAACKSPYYKLIKHIRIPFSGRFNIEMITNLRFDYILRLENTKYHPKQFKTAYEKTFNNTLETTLNPYLRSRLLQWKEFMESDKTLLEQSRASLLASENKGLHASDSDDTNDTTTLISCELECLTNTLSDDENDTLTYDDGEV